MQSEEAGGEFSRTHHGRQHDLSSVVDAIPRNGNPLRSGCHDGRCKTEHTMARFLEGWEGCWSVVVDMNPE
jgi:hypothetical protein